MLPTSSQWRKWSLPAKYSALGLLVSVLSVALFNIPSLFAAKEKDLEFNRLAFRSAHELRNNREYLQALSRSASDSKRRIPVGAIKTSALYRLFGEYHSRLVDESYGEEKYLYQFILRLRNAAAAISNIKSNDEVVSFNKNYDMTIDDLLFFGIY